MIYFFVISKNDSKWRHLFVGFEDVAAEQVAARIAGDVAEDLQILTVVRNVKDPAKNANCN